MAVIDTTNIIDTSYLISQTPPNLSKDNYYLSTLQKKVNADWRYRPNRCDIEKEVEFGKDEYCPLEVVLQSVKNDKGQSISKDFLRIVFKDIRQKKKIGQRYRFSYNFDASEPNEDKNIWIGINQDELMPTSSQVIQRCNGTIMSIWTDEKGNEILHEEPVAQTDKFTSSVGFGFNEVAIDPNGRIIITAQYNKYTKQYYINQRFIIGPNRVYKVANILATDSQSTYKADNAGIIRLYLDMDQTSELDNFETRLAYNGVKDTPFVPEKRGEYTLTVIDPTSTPDVLTTLRFRPVVLVDGKPEEYYNVNVECLLVGVYADKASISDFVTLSEKDEDGYYTLTRVKEDLTMKVKVVCSCNVGYDEEDEDLKCEFVMKLFGE